MAMTIGRLIEELQNYYDPSDVVIAQFITLDHVPAGDGMNVSVAPSSVGLSQARPITIAVLAMGGQGGGVLVDWIVERAPGAITALAGATRTATRTRPSSRAIAANALPVASALHTTARARLDCSRSATPLRQAMTK